MVSQSSRTSTCVIARLSLLRGRCPLGLKVILVSSLSPDGKKGHVSLPKNRVKRALLIFRVALQLI